MMDFANRRLDSLMPGAVAAHAGRISNGRKKAPATIEPQRQRRGPGPGCASRSSPLTVAQTDYEEPIHDAVRFKILRTGQSRYWARSKLKAVAEHHSRPTLSAASELAQTTIVMGIAKGKQRRRQDFVRIACLVGMHVPAAKS
jgi:hypothetical protein